MVLHIARRACTLTGSARIASTRFAVLMQKYVLRGGAWIGLHRHALITCLAFAYLQYGSLVGTIPVGRGKVRWRRLPGPPSPSLPSVPKRLSRGCSRISSHPSSALPIYLAIAAGPTSVRPHTLKHPNSARSQ